MTRLRALIASIVVAVAVVITSATGSHAADGSIAFVEPTADGVQILVSVPPEVDVDLAEVEVTIDGQEASSEAALAGSTTTVRRTAVLAIDTSNSMRGDRFAAAKAASLAFLESAPDDVYVGIVTFDSDVTANLEPSLDRARARQVIGSLSLSQDTLLYDGVLAGVDLSGTEGQRTVLVLSDGADTSDTAIEEVTSVLADSDVLVDVVALDEQEGAALTALQQLADAGRGEVIESDSAALAKAFSARADVLARQVVVNAQLPAGFTATEATLQVSLPTSGGPVVVESYSTIQDAPAADGAPTVGADDAGLTLPAWAKYAGMGAFGLGLVVLLVLLVPRKPAPVTIEDRVSHYTRAGPSGATAVSAPRIDSEAALTSAKEAAAGMLRHSAGLEARITHRLEGAGSELKSSEWLLVQAAIFIGAGTVGLLLGQGNLFVGILFLVIGVFGPWLYLGFRRSRRRKAFNSMLPETLQMMSGSLSAGLSLAQSVDTIVREGSDPIASEFKRVLVETRLGVDLEDAFDGVAQRFESKDFEWVVMAIKIQRQVGGNLAELLETVAATMREREYMRRQVAALAAEGKLSAYVLSALPPLFLIYLVFANRDYVMPLFTDIRGIIMLVAATLWLGVGIFWMSKLVKVEV